MKQLHLFFVLLFTLWVSNTNAQTNVDIGTSSSNSDNSPIQRNAAYSSAELIYFNSEINLPGLISGLGFYKSSGSTSVTIDSVYIYLKTTTDTSLTSFGSTAGYTLVYQGPFPNTTATSGWMTINFNMVSNFQYNPSGNLAVLVVRPNQTATTNRPYYRYTTYTGSARNAWFAKSYAWSDTATRTISNWRPNIRLKITATCAVPTAPTATNITATTADLDWTQTGTPINYEVKYGPQGFSPYTAGTSVFTTTKPYTLNPPLTPNTNYSYYVRAICAAGDTSAWSAVKNFTTPVTCPAPTSATATNITPFTADLNWNFSGSPMTYEVKYGAQGFNVATAGTSVYTTTKPYTLNPPLTPNTNYSYYVRAICTVGDTSAWSAVANFATPPTCVAPTSPTATGITKNAAVLNWTNTGSPINYEIRYGAQGFNMNTAGTSVFTTTKPYTLNPPLASSTNYSYYVRSICTSGDTSAWSPVKNFTTLCDYPDVLSTTNGTACMGGTATLQATTEASGNLKWYANASGGTVLGTGNNFTTPALNVSDTFFVESSQLLSAGSVGRGSMASNNYVQPNSYGQGLIFNALSNIVIDSVGVWINASAGGVVSVGLANSSNVITDSVNFNIPAYPSASATNPVKVYLPVNFVVPAATGYKLIALPTSTNIQLGRENSVNPPYPYSNAYISVTSAFTTSAPPAAMTFTANSGNYYYFYDIFLSGQCVNPTRQPVIATVTPNPLTALPDTSGTCNGTAATLNSGSANTTWTPTNVLYTNANATTAYTGGAMQTVYAKVTAPTTVYVTTTSGSCTFNDSVFVDLQTGTAVDITPSAASMACGNAMAVALTSNTPVTWKMNGGSLYTDINGTTAYTGTSITNVYAKSNNNRNVIGSYNIGGCTFADTAVITVTNPAAVAIANNSGAGNTDSSVIAGAIADLHNADCELMSSVIPAGSTPLNGVLNGKIIMDGSVQNTATGPYVTRHFELTPQAGASTATANITLYFTQAEFDAYNAFVTANGNSAVNPLLPSGPGGSIANIWIDKFNAASGSPSPVNNNSVVVIAPTSVTWDATNNWWAVTFPTTGFSGFFLHTNTTATPLPIIWNTFNASLNKQNQAVIDWSVAEKETIQYDIQKSLDGNRFAAIGTVISKGNGINSYSFTESAALNGKAWYRIAQKGKNNEVNYSNIMMLQNSAIYGQINIYPNPATQVLNIEVPQSDVPYHIFDLQGRAIMNGLLNSGKNALNVSGLVKGFYTIRIGETVQKFVLN